MLALAFLVQTTSGCLSHEYQIPHDELARLARAPVEARGHHVRVIEELGTRRGPALTFHDGPPVVSAAAPPVAPIAPEPAAPDPEAVAYEEEFQAPLPGDAGEARDDARADLRLDLRVDGSGSQSGGSSGSGIGHPIGPRPGAPGGSAWRGNPASGAGVRGTPTGAGFRGSPPAGGASGVSPRGAASGSGHGGGIGHIGGGGGGGHSSGSSGGGGGGGGDALVLLAVVLVAVAVIAGVALVASEGIRFDGYTDMAADQSIHLKNQAGVATTVSLATLTPANASDAVEALVEDDEGHGLGLRERAALDRTGLAFKLDLGAANFNRGVQQVAGMASQIQVGGFFTPRAGIMLDIGLSGGSVCCAAGVFTRHSLALEAQYFPAALGRLHFGAFAKGGIAIAGDATSVESGPIFGGGALVELALSTRLALTLRAAANAAQLDTSGWSTAGALTGGIAVY